MEPLLLTLRPYVGRPRWSKEAWARLLNKEQVGIIIFWRLDKVWLSLNASMVQSMDLEYCLSQKSTKTKTNLSSPPPMSRPDSQEKRESTKILLSP